MPTLNYENVGALVGYDYLQGTIDALYPEDDTADVTLKYKVVTVPAVPATLTTSAIEEETEDVEVPLTKVPIFYHCTSTSVTRNNGALTGAINAFAVGDMVIVLKAIGQAASSLNSLDQIELKGVDSTATGPKYYVVALYEGMRSCENNILFFQVYSDNGGNYLGVYDIAGARIQSYDLNTLASGDITRPLYVNYGCYETNMVVVNIETYVELVPGGGYDWISYTYKIPIRWYFSDLTSLKLVMGNLSHGEANASSSTLGGFSFTYNEEALLRGAHTQSPYGTVDLQVTRYTHIDGVYYPSDWELHLTKLSGGGWYEGQFFTCVRQWYDGIALPCYVGAFNVPLGDEAGLGYGTGLWFFDAEPNWITTYLDRVVVEDIADTGYYIDQIFCYDGKLFIFYSYPVHIDMHSIEDGSLLASCSIAISAPSPPYLEDEPVQSTKAVIMTLEGYKRLCVQWHFNNVVKTDIHFLDLDTLETVRTVALQGDYPITGTYSCVPVMRPDKPQFLVALSNYRMDNGACSIAHSPTASQVAMEHARWCVENARCSHVGEDDSTHYSRLKKQCIYNGGEVISLVSTTTSAVEISTAITGWDESPEHKAILLADDVLACGYGVVTYPESVHTITLGEGMALPGGGYSTEDTEWELPEEAYGKIRIYVCNLFKF